MEYFKSKKAMLWWSRSNLLVYSSQRQLDPEGTGLAHWRPVGDLFDS